jgi:hypothetical protein
MGVLPDILDRKVRGDIGGRERGEGDRDEDELHLRGWHGDGRELRIAEPRAGERQHGLHDRDGKSED